MGKKKFKDIKKYTQSQFIGIICNRCGFCRRQGIKKPTASFCYDLYEYSTTSFMNKMLKKLKSTTKDLFNFEDIFCDGCSLFTENTFYSINMGLTNKASECIDIQQCLTQFENQIENNINTEENIPFNEIKKCTKCSKTPLPVFFTNENENWNIFIKDSLNDFELKGVPLNEKIENNSS